MIKELLPAIKKDPSYLVDHNYTLLNWKGEEINPFSINWNLVTADNWKYRIEQGSGPENALGEVVIQFPNAFSIFMHDTPSKWAFKLDQRHVSHGCIRMENPLEMVEFITSFNKTDNYDEILVAMGKEPVRDEKKIKKYQEDLKDSVKAKKLKPKPNAYFKSEVSIPVYIVYFTASKNGRGGIDYFHDGYRRDIKLLDHLHNKSVAAMPVKQAQLKAQQSFSP
jgi:murein L,D-transpeptidase YcbB/YkuD